MIPWCTSCQCRECAGFCPVLKASWICLVDCYIDVECADRLAREPTERKPSIREREREREREMFHLTTHSTHFIYGYMASDIWLRTSRGALAGKRNSSMGPPPWRIDPMTHRTMSERSYHGATSLSLLMWLGFKSLGLKIGITFIIKFCVIIYKGAIIEYVHHLVLVGFFI